MTESVLKSQVLLACSNGGTRLFRNNTGMGWTGRVIDQTARQIILEDYRPLRAGLCTGSSDLIGWTTRGNVAIFTALELKTGRGKLTPEQAAFLENVRAAGGIGAEVRSVEDAVRALTPPAR